MTSFYTLYAYKRFLDKKAPYDRGFFLERECYLLREDLAMNGYKKSYRASK